MLVFKVLGRLIRRFFIGIGHLLAGIFRLLRRHELALGIVVVVGLVLGGIYLLLSALNINIVMGEPQTTAPAPVIVAAATPTAAPAPTAAAAAVSRTNAPDATEAFMRGQVTFNADQVWNAMGAELHTALQGQGLDKSAIERQFAAQKSQGIQYETYQYIGGYKTPENSSIHFYVLRLRDNNNKPVEETFTFRLGEDGKIMSYSLS